MTSPRVVRVLLVGPAPASADSRGGMATVMRAMLDHPDPAYRVRHVSTFVDASIARRAYVGVRGMIVSAFLVLTGRVDVLHVHLAHGGSVVRKSAPLVAARVRGVPSVIHAHSFDFAGWYRALPGPARIAARAALPASRWLVLGSALAQEYSDALRLDPSSVDVLYNPAPGGASSSDPVRLRQRDEVRAVALGRIGERKGSYDVVDAVAALHPDVRARLDVVMAGDGDVAGVRARVAERGVSDTVTVQSWIGPDERDTVLAASDVFLLPSYREGLPMALLEAMAAGLAPVVSPAGSIGEVVTDGTDALVVRAGDVGGLTDALERLVTDSELRRRIGRAAADRAAAIDAAAWYAALARVWSDLASSSRGRTAHLVEDRP